MKKTCFFVSDLHGKINLYQKLFDQIKEKTPDAVFLGGDLLPAGMVYGIKNSSVNISFTDNFLGPELEKLKQEMGEKFPEIFIILGNDDPKLKEEKYIEYNNQELFRYIHCKKVKFGEFTILGYSFVPPTPFLLKDWERYDVDIEVNPGCVHPDDGFFTLEPEEGYAKKTIQQDLKELSDGIDFSKAILLFHSPPYNTGLDRAALDGVMVDDKEVDFHVGSKAITNLINEKQPLITLHGHIHESSRITGRWKEKMKNTWAFSAANDEDGLSIVEFDPYSPEKAVRVVI